MPPDHLFNLYSAAGYDIGEDNLQREYRLISRLSLYEPDISRNSDVNGCDDSTSTYDSPVDHCFCQIYNGQIKRNIIAGDKKCLHQQYIPESTNKDNSNISEVVKSMNEEGNTNVEKVEKKKTRAKKLSLKISSKEENVLSEFAEFTTNEELIKIHKDFRSGQAQTPLSGLKLIRMDDGSSPYLHCFRYFSQPSPSSLVQYLDKDHTPDANNPYFIKYKMSSIINDDSLWPVVWTCFGRACRVQYTKDDYRGPIVPLDNPVEVDKDVHLQEFQKYWKTMSKFLVVDKNLISPTLAQIKICSQLNADRHAGHLNILLPVQHPFYVENKGWCQVDSRNVFFKSLMKMDVITILEEEKFFNFDDYKPYARTEDSRISNPQEEIKPPSVVSNEEMMRQIQTIPQSIQLAHRDNINVQPFYSQPCCPYMNNQIPHIYQMDQQYVSNYPMPTIPIQQQFPNITYHYYNQPPVNYNPNPEETSQDNRFYEDSSRENSKRPMNGFMIFARQMRLKLINENPGKDNRVISKILGEKWRELSEEEKRVFTEEAKSLSNQRLKVNPLCWKRKNSQKKPRKSYQTELSYSHSPHNYGCYTPDNPYSDRPDSND